jgi:UDP:flavonoid glycosyltransferase YjiC (YdhE family)
MVALQRKFILVPAGSSGDIYPFAWLGKGLASLGHEVVAVVHRPFDRTMEAAGLRAVAYGTDEDFEQIIRHPDLWHPRRGFELVVRATSLGYPQAIPWIRAESAPGRTLLVGAGIAFGARIGAEADRIPLVTVQLQPIAFMSAMDPPVIGAGFEWFRRVPRRVRRALYRIGDVYTDRLVAPGINACRAQLGLSRPVRRIMREYWMSPFKVLGLFPDWYGPKQDDWPPQAVTTRFPLYDESDRNPVEPDLERFLAEGAPPLLFTAGSANVQARRFFEVALEACVRLGARGLFVTRYPEQLPAALPPGFRHCAYVPFSRVFSRCRVVVHHGGIGTTAQGLAAGVPQLVMAMSHDQPDNGYRLTRLGIGAYLYPRGFTPDRVAMELARLMSSTGVKRACLAYRDRMAAQMPEEAVFRMLEETHRSGCDNVQ